jgi:hypothetical protein
MTVNAGRSRSAGVDPCSWVTNEGPRGSSQAQQVRWMSIPCSWVTNEGPGGSSQVAADPLGVDPVQSVTNERPRGSSPAAAAKDRETAWTACDWPMRPARCNTTATHSPSLGADAPFDLFDLILEHCRRAHSAPPRWVAWLLLGSYCFCAERFAPS